MDQITFLSSPGFTIGAADITTASSHNGSLPKKETILAVGVPVVGYDKHGKKMQGPISSIKYFGDAKLIYIEKEPGKEVRIHQVTPLVDDSGPSRSTELPKSIYQRMEPRYGPIGESIMDYELFSSMSEGRDIVITLPKTIAWSNYELELSEAEKGAVMNFKVPFFPKDCIGGKCYVVHDGKVKGWMTITGVSEKEFQCETTGTTWSGKFIERSGKFNKLKDSVDMKGFQGWRYATAEIV